MGASPVEIVLVRGQLQIQSGQLEAGRATLAKAHAAGIQDPRLILLDADAALRGGGPAAADLALSILDSGATRYPEDLAIQRLRLQVVVSNQRWQAAVRAVDGLKMALYANHGSAGEAHVAAARIQSQLGRWTDAFGEYRIALADSPGDVGLWLEFGRVAEQAGRQATAREAFAEAARLNPASSEVKSELRRIDERRAQMREAAMKQGLLQ